MRTRQRIIFLLFFLIGGAILTSMLITMQSSLLDAVVAKYGHHATHKPSVSPDPTGTPTGAAEPSTSLTATP